MQMSKIVATAGGTLIVIGVLVLFRFGFPQPTFTVEESYLGLQPANVLPNGKTVEQARADAESEKTKYQRVSSMALALIVFGSVLQLIAIWL